MLGETHNNLVLAPDLHIKTNNNHAEVWKCFYNSIFWQHVQIGSQLLKVPSTCVSRHLWHKLIISATIILWQLSPTSSNQWIWLEENLIHGKHILYTRKQTRNASLILHDGRGSGVAGLIEHSKTSIMKTTNGKSGITNPLFSTRSLQHRLTTCN